MASWSGLTKGSAESLGYNGCMRVAKMPANQDLLTNLRQGKPEACMELFESYADRIFRLACGMLCDETLAEDVVQETFIKALLNLDSFECRASLGTWLYRIAYNASLARLRRHDKLFSVADFTDPHTEQLLVPEQLERWHASPEELLINAEVCAELDRQICDLPLPLRVVFILRDVEGLSTAETAVALDISPRTVRKRHDRARLELRARLAIYFREQNKSKAASLNELQR